MDRYLKNHLNKDLLKKPVILSGPRQCGKTYLSKDLDKNFDYLNFDVAADRKRLLKLDWSSEKKLIIFDEIHKMKKWKNWLKGVFDSRPSATNYLVTGSSRLNTYKKVGDSLAGRYLNYRLYPMDPKEISTLKGAKDKNISQLTPLQILNRFLERSGFPEPFLSEEKSFYQKWQQTHMDVILKQDILETQNVSSIKQLETLALLLTERVGSTLSFNSLREDLGTDDKTIKRWVQILEDNFMIFRIPPYSTKSMITGIKKANKIYFFDYVRVEDSAARIENLVALSLLKEVHYRQDALGEVYDLFFMRDKSQKEIDFLITHNRKPHLVIEVKEGEDQVSENFRHFEKHLAGVRKIQLVKNLKTEYQNKNGVSVLSLADWLQSESLF